MLGCTVSYFMRTDEKSDELRWEYQEFEKILKHNVWRVFLLSWEDLDIVSPERLKKWYFSKNFWDFKFPKSVRAYTDAFYGYEYLKIAEGCNNSCSFCIIPKIRWKQKSLPIEKILQEAQNMINSGVREIILIAQDTTRYGIDLYKKPALFELLEKLDSLEGDFVYRILYLYPDILSLEHLKKLKNLKKFLPYFDIPLQHISWKLLKSMWRFYNTEQIYKFLDFIHENFENSFIRTNFIIWFPWETQEDVEELINFVKKWYFSNIALFEYHDEPLALSSKLPNKVDDKTLKQRFQQISQVVDEILEEKNQQRKKQVQIGYIQEILQTSWNSSDLKLVVRPYLHAPEIDEVDEISYDEILWVYNEDGTLQIGDLIQYKIS